jgi:hypothetical protein
MAEPVKNKGELTEKLEADRQKMAVQAIELQHSFNVSRWFRASVQRYPSGWILGAVIAGFLVSRLPPREKRIYLWVPAADDSHRNRGQAPTQGKRVKKLAQEERKYPDKDKHDSRFTHRLWPVIKPIVSAYIAREIYNRVRGRQESVRGE